MDILLLLNTWCFGTTVMYISCLEYGYNYFDLRYLTRSNYVKCQISWITLVINLEFDLIVKALYQVISQKYVFSNGRVSHCSVCMHQSESLSSKQINKFTTFLIGFFTCQLSKRFKSKQPIVCDIIGIDLRTHLYRDLETLGKLSLFI